MSGHLTIRNFGPIKDATIELRNLVVLTGGQGTGKSTIAKILTICQDLFFYILILENDERVMQSFHFLGIADYFQENSYIEYKKGDVGISYQNGEFALTHDKYANKEELLNFYKKAIFNEVRRTAVSMGITEEESLEDFIRKNSLFMTGNRGTSFYIPAERNLAGAFSNVLANMLLNNIPLPPVFLNYLSYFEKARNEFPVYNLPFLHLTYKYANGKEGLVVQKDGKDELLPLNRCSSGIQSLLPMMMILDFCIEKNFFDSYVIEEPEQNLFPENQLAVLRYLIERTKQIDYESCHVVTTHSPYLLSGINISLLAGLVSEKAPTEANDILPERFQLKPGSVAAYSLGDEETYCRNIINSDTGIIDQNYLDTASAITGEEFAKLYKLYIRALKNEKL